MIEDIFNRIDEERDNHETLFEQADDEETEAYHRGWVEATKWLLEVLEPLVRIDRDHEEW